MWTCETLTYYFREWITLTCRVFSSSVLNIVRDRTYTLMVLCSQYLFVTLDRWFRSCSLEKNLLRVTGYCRTQLYRLAVPSFTFGFVYEKVFFQKSPLSVFAIGSKFSRPFPLLLFFHSGSSVYRGYFSTYDYFAQ